MKQFVKRIGILLGVLAVVSVVICVCIDPYNVYHWRRIRANGVEPNKNYIKMRYLLEQEQEYDAFLFGSSRVGSIHVEKLQDCHCYNMTYSEGIPEEHLENLKTLLAHGMVPKRVYLGVDSISYSENYKEHQDSALRASYETLQNPLVFIKLYTNASVAMEAIPTIIEGTSKETFGEDFYNYGWWCSYEQKPVEHWEEELQKNRRKNSVTENYMEESLAAIRGIKDLCDANGIELIVFTNPMYGVVFDQSMEVGYADFLKNLAEITPYYNFSGHNAITDDPANYIDASHYNAYVGDWMMEVMAGGEAQQGFGTLVTAENAEDVIASLVGE